MNSMLKTALIAIVAVAIANKIEPLADLIG